MNHKTVLTLEPLEPFDFYTTVDSHGWRQLAPFHWDHERGMLSRPEVVSSGVVEMGLRGTSIEETPAVVWVVVSHDAKLTQDDVEQLRLRAARILGVDNDLSRFHQLCRGSPGFEGVLEKGKGRLLLGSSLFEDIVKTILTTNVNWAGTIRMVGRLVDALGTPLPRDEGGRTFPTAEQIVAGAGQLLDGNLGLGYRGPYIVELARRICDGDLDLSRLEDPDLDADDLYRKLREMKGVGDYAASSIMMLLGRTERIPVDSWARKMVAANFFDCENVTDKQIAGIFSEFGRWRGLAFWFYTWPQ